MRFQLLSFVAAIAACSGSGSGKATTSASGQRTFPTPDSAVQAVFHALATNDMAALDKLGKLTKKDDGSMEIEIASQMITKDNAAEFFCKGFGDDPECK